MQQKVFMADEQSWTRVVTKSDQWRERYFGGRFGSEKINFCYPSFHDYNPSDGAKDYDDQNFPDQPNLVAEGALILERVFEALKLKKNTISRVEIKKSAAMIARTLTARIFEELSNVKTGFDLSFDNCGLVLIDIGPMPTTFSYWDYTTQDYKGNRFKREAGTKKLTLGTASNLGDGFTIIKEYAGLNCGMLFSEVAEAISNLPEDVSVLTPQHLFVASNQIFKMEIDNTVKLMMENTKSPLAAKSR